MGPAASLVALSQRALDARKAPGYPPYTHLSFDVPIPSEGDVNARVIDEVYQSLRLIEQILERLPAGAARRDRIVDERSSCFALLQRAMTWGFPCAAPKGTLNFRSNSSRSTRHFPK